MHQVQKKYPYQNLSTEDIKGELWEDIPGLDGYYLISSFGRVRRQQYEMQYKNGAIYVKPEKIIKPAIVKLQNNFKNDFTYFLTVRVTLSGKRYSFMVARMVYYCFVKIFDLDDYDIVILCKDTDNFNIQPSNLLMATLNQKQQRVADRKRFKSPLSDIDEQDRLKRTKSILKTLSKQVTQYSMKGRKIRTYPSASEAEKATGVFATAIGNVASGGNISAGGFVWRWNKQAEVDVAALRKEKRNDYVKKYGQKVTQYDLSGRKINQFPSVKDAAEATGVHVNAINMVLRGKYKSTKGFFWKKGYGKDVIDLSDYKYGHESTAVTQSKAVKQYSLTGEYIQTFPSVKEAAQSIGVTRGTLSAAAQGKQKSSGGFKWKHA